MYPLLTQIPSSVVAYSETEYTIVTSQIPTALFVPTQIPSIRLIPVRDRLKTIYYIDTDTSQVPTEEVVTTNLETPVRYRLKKLLLHT